VLSEYKKEKARIEKFADQWCKDNGYPIQRQKYIYKGKWIKNEL
jgi:hypothetical protein